MTICPCDGSTPHLPVNLPQQNQIRFRFGDYAQFRRAVLTPVEGEQSITAWRTQGEGDLAVMMAEWFAYLGDILTFYDERIANESYLRTAALDASAKRLIQILGYRPPSRDRRHRAARRAGHQGPERHPAARAAIPEQAGARPAAADLRARRGHADRCAGPGAGQGAARAAVVDRHFPVPAP
jgi:hypothetical protein